MQGLRGQIRKLYENRKVCAPCQCGPTHPLITVATAGGDEEVGEWDTAGYEPGERSAERGIN
jgi:hypothetical protein